MKQESAQNNHIHPITMRIWLFVVLLISGAVVVSSVNWIYYRIHTRLGLEIAEVVVAFLTVLIVILILFGFWAGFRADRILHRRKIQALWICRTLKRYRVMRSLWQYVEPGSQPKGSKPSTLEKISIPEHAPRRGRRPTHSLGRWIKVVHAWENRNLQQNTMTLSEYLAEQFGTYADGSPRMSENSYYEWRKRVRKELLKTGIKE
ncbi:MAG TPA: hypothetical protein VLA72_18520 [Anaerolineales bacterium]|nr:hypothetical protein [Anaerolineales bacterium]